ncbi:MAG: hypothetical protein ACP5ER_03145 [Candidatus Bathyarchaeales archaeon]
MNKKVIALIMIAASMLLLAPIANAQPPTLTVWTDKSEYATGETGTLHIVFYNDENYAVTVEKIIVIFDEWRAYLNGQWEGNQTIEVNQAVVSKGVYEKETKFTVPTDGRAKSTCVHITIQTTELGNIHDYPFITLVETSKYMEQIVTLFTIQVVLIIVCTIIIAATIFLSARRPRVMWRREERPE